MVPRAKQCTSSSKTLTGGTQGALDSLERRLGCKHPANGIGGLTEHFIGKKPLYIEMDWFFGHWPGTQDLFWGQCEVKPQRMWNTSTPRKVLGSVGLCRLAGCTCLNKYILYILEYIDRITIGKSYNQYRKLVIFWFGHILSTPGCLYIRFCSDTNAANR